MGLRWAQALVVVRNHLVSSFGLHAETSANVWKPAVKDSYAPEKRSSDSISIHWTTMKS
jgi:hypothetical protein